MVSPTTSAVAAPALFEPRPQLDHRQQQERRDGGDVARTHAPPGAPVAHAGEKQEHRRRRSPAPALASRRGPRATRSTRRRDDPENQHRARTRTGRRRARIRKVGNAVEVRQRQPVEAGRVRRLREHRILDVAEREAPGPAEQRRVEGAERDGRRQRARDERPAIAARDSAPPRRPRARATPGPPGTRRHRQPPPADPAAARRSRIRRASCFACCAGGRRAASSSRMNAEKAAAAASAWPTNSPP